MKTNKALFTLKILHRAMLVGQFLFAAVAYYLVYQAFITPQMREQERLFQVISIVFAAAGVLGGSILFKKKLQEIRNSNNTVVEKFSAYRSASIIRWAMLEGPCIFCLVGFLLIGNYAFMALAGVLILLFAMTSPTGDKVASDLGISQQELDQLG